MTGSTTDRNDRSATAVDEVALIEGAAAGDADAFDALFRYLAPSTWNFASGVSGDPDLAADAVVAAFATALTAVRAGRIDTASGLRLALVTATRNHLADAGGGDGHSASAHSLAIGFGALPEKLRSALWLSSVDGSDHETIGTAIGSPAGDTPHLVARGRQGLMVGVIRAEGGDNPSPLCGPSIDRLRRDTARNLTVAERALLRRHLRLCADCRSRHAAALSATDRLATLALPFPESLIDHARAAFAAVVTPGARGTGLSPTTEKVVAALSASVAAVGMAGATVWGTASPASQPSVAIGPVVSLVGGPQPPLELPAIVNFEPESTATDGGGAGGSPSGTGGQSSSGTTGGESTGTSGADDNTAVSETSNDMSDAIIPPESAPQTPAPPPTTAPPGGSESPPPADETNEPLLKVGVDGLVNIELGDDPAIDVGPDAEGTGIDTGGFLDVLAPVTGALDATLNTLLGN